MLLTAAFQTLGPRLAKWCEAMSLACGTSDLPTSISDAYERDAARGVLKTRQNQTRLTPSSLRRGLEDGLPSNSAEALGAAVLAACAAAGLLFYAITDLRSRLESRADEAETSRSLPGDG